MNTIPKIMNLLNAKLYKKSLVNKNYHPDGSENLSKKGFLLLEWPQKKSWTNDTKLSPGDE
jgi:hypothetical protein